MKVVNILNGKFDNKKSHKFFKLFFITFFFFFLINFFLFSYFSHNFSNPHTNNKPHFMSNYYFKINKKKIPSPFTQTHVLPKFTTPSNTYILPTNSINKIKIITIIIVVFGFQFEK